MKVLMAPVFTDHNTVKKQKLAHDSVYFEVQYSVPEII